MAITWTRYENQNVINIENARSVLNLLRGTSVQHDNEFSMTPSGRPFTATNLMNKINNTYPAAVDLPDGPIEYGKQYNWMNASLALDDNKAPVIAILYHLHRHRIKAAAKGLWGISIGFLPNLVTKPNTSDVNSDTDSYYLLAKEITARIKIDLGNLKPSPGKYCVMYDNIDSSEDPADPPGKNNPNRRRTRIGELGWLSENTTKPLSLKKFSSTRFPRPVDKDGIPMKGWQLVDGKIVETILEAI